MNYSKIILWPSKYNDESNWIKRFHDFWLQRTRNHKQILKRLWNLAALQLRDDFETRIVNQRLRTKINHMFRANDFGKIPFQ